MVEAHKNLAEVDNYWAAVDKGLAVVDNCLVEAGNRWAAVDRHQLVEDNLY